MLAFDTPAAQLPTAIDKMNNLYADERDGYLEEWLGNFSKAELLARR